VGLPVDVNKFDILYDIGSAGDYFKAVTRILQSLIWQAGLRTERLG
jgi:soluble P-type ATPase